MTKSKDINAPRAIWTAPMLQQIQQLYPNKLGKTLAAELGVSLSVLYKKAKELGLKKSEAFYASAQSGLLRGDVGACTRFQPGQKPWTTGMKGVRMSPGSEFKKGSVPANKQEIGALRINTLGEIDIKVGPGGREWLSLRRYVWEMAHGPIPPGMCVVPDNGDGHDTRIENLLLVTRAENIQINLVRRYPRELRLAMQLRGKLASQILKSQEACHG